MPAVTTERSAFRNLDIANEVDRPPVSNMSIFAFFIGLISLTAPLSFYLLPLSIVAMAVGAIVLWRLTRDASARGSRLAQVGLGLGVVSSVWCLTATANDASYLYNEAARNATIYLETLGKGELYQALELHVPTPNRQIAGTDLESHYRSKQGETADMALGIINAPSTQAVVNTGSSAKWELKGGLDIRRDRSLQTITVEMQNVNDPNQVVHVTLNRRFYVDSSDQPVAFWNVDRMILPAPPTVEFAPEK